MHVQPLGLLLEKQALNQAGVKAVLAQSGMSKPFSQAGWQAELRRVNAHNNLLEQRIGSYKTRRSELAAQRQSILAVQDIAGLKLQLAAKEKSLSQVEEELKKALSEIGLRGNYVVVIRSLGFLEPLAKQQAQASQDMLAQVVEELNGSFLSSFTQVDAGLLSEKTVKEWIQGRMILQPNPFKSGLATNQELYVLGVTAEVSSLRSAEGLSVGKAGNSRLVKCVNMQGAAEVVKRELLEAGLEEAEIKSLLEYYEQSALRAQVTQHNQEKLAQVKRLNKRAKEESNTLQREIAELKNLIQNQDNRVNAVLRQLGLNTNGDTPEKISRINGHIQQKMRVLEDSIVFCLEAKYEHYVTPVNLTGDIPTDMATAAMGGLSQLNTRQAAGSYMRYLEVRNGQVVEFKEDKELSFTRKIERMWLIPIGGQGNQYQMALIAKYKISKEAELENQNEISCNGCTEAQRKVVEEVARNMVEIPGGSFMMGCMEGDEECEEDEKPRHYVTLNSFKMSKYEVTQGQWEAIMGINLRQQRDKVNPDRAISGEGANFPIYYVSWDEAKEFIKQLNYLTKGTYRLPSEAEWEFAARGGSKTIYSGSDSVGRVAWYMEDSVYSTNPVGQKNANGYSLFDMSGNVWEWCEDRYVFYEKTIPANSQNLLKDNLKVVRSGGWIAGAFFCRNSNREGESSSYQNFTIGFRLAQ